MSEMRLAGGMRITTKIGISVGLICLFLIGAILQYRATLERAQERFLTVITVAEPIKGTSLELHRILLKASMYEERFQNNHDPALVKEVLGALEEARKWLQELKRLEKLEAHDAADTAVQGDELVRRLAEQFDRYKSAFTALAAAHTVRGLNHDQGLLGQLRNSAHVVEGMLNEKGRDAARLQYLTARRSEKDFLLRGAKEEAVHALAEVEVLRGMLEKMALSEADGTRLQQAVSQYAIALSGIQAKDQDLIRLQREMGEALAMIEKLVGENAAVAIRDMAETVVTTRHDLEKDSETALLISLAAILIALLSGGFIVRDVRGSLRNVISAISTSTAEIAATINQQERVASLQASSVNETNTTMEELGASARQSAEQAQSAANSTEKAMELAEHGMSRVEDMLGGMRTTREKVDAIARQILSLSEQTSQIANITNTVTDFANETKMLAMNAAVEAVRAGEHGKGFSVLSVEIRKLADESKRSAERIGGLVEEIQRATNATVMVTEEGSKTVEKGMEIAQNTAETFSEVADSVGHASESSQQISLNVRQQSVAVKQVVEAMNALNTGAKETASGISQVKSGIQTLNETAQKLKEMI